MKFICGIAPAPGVGRGDEAKRCGARFDTLEALADHINGNEFKAKHHRDTNPIRKEKQNGDSHNERQPRSR